MNWFDTLSGWAQSFERTAIDVISIITPWLAPAIPASMAHANMIERLGFDNNTAWVGALAVEFLGLTAINTAVEFWRYNEDKHYRQSLIPVKRGKKRKFNGAPMWLALLTGAFYIVLVLFVNALLDIGHSSDVQIVSKAGLSLLSVVSGVIIALRASHSRRTTPKKRVQRGSGAKTTEVPAETKPVQIKTKEDYFAANQSRNGQGHIPAKTLMSEHGIPKSTAFQWQKEWLDANPSSNPKPSLN